MLVIFLFAIDATIVSTSMPTIVAKLGGLELYSWVFSIYMLTSALTTPIFGKLADLFSQRRLMLIGIAIFVLGSTLCGAAQSMEAMVVFRADSRTRRRRDLCAVVHRRRRDLSRRAARQDAGHHQRHLGHCLDPRSAGRRRHCRILELALGLFRQLADHRDRHGAHRHRTQRRPAERHGPKLDIAGAVTLLVGLMLIILRAVAKRPRAPPVELRVT